ncbi:MAG: hypothetical protein A3B74_04255 [Candidatus Kerfeldbacteria bacterium RIFCSPHIGHO2_02_FULL_42_14]|uniref:O-antigen ligase-related domain-containing protein n=1 Tax=Candidatus Kerfeldbacteria bacterium RIFCSPHIGHO2_02_FULL_42_14 TaxID=1798540 RepID=A0A1G2ARD2_9BACT|nr:MAG: hypothetical protein A3B74_04255 [Candidatus Kerfeldbacteria bacterium RIFCSPHIGHO2_02_FULL_42_14]OGY81187.1 MAG: hypothetical protein A3E60_02765 [Candidatus Kerfeldbacteria bacterium RIFCSPHIGHO2_12_FULL_42_13]OGY83393.1 MAG: hypothetical protein A3I91_01945 [Candidatus Kerfeldbacteria bacterium RIFCSPLOWO2_02_FULL_42_19]OGY85484.1 MAG: hypothetical protein A3G01_03560 [Candidatus Kerfeldbacteria bacterium RIFCSPLOWO2_12_FULL_43_9]
MRHRLSTFLSMLVYVFVFLLPLQTRWMLTQGTLNNELWEYGSFSLYAIDILFFLILTTWLISHAQYKKTTNDRSIPHAPHSALIIVFMLLAVIGFFSLTWSLDSKLSGYAWLRLMEGLILVGILQQSHIHTKKILWALLAAGVFQSIFAYIQFAMQEVPETKWLGLAAQSPLTHGVSVIETSQYRLLRSYGSFPHPNMLAGWLLITLFAGSALVMTSGSIKKRFIVTVGSLIITLGIFLTFSRSAWLALLFGLLIAGIATSHTHYRARQWKWIGIILFLFLTLIASSSEIVFSRLASNARLEQQSQETRKLYTTQALQLLHDDQWIFGVGLGTYTYAVYKKIDDTQPGWWYQPVHYVPLIILIEIGIFGLLAYIILLITIGISLAQYTSHHAPYREYAEHAKRSMLFLPMTLNAALVIFLGSFDHYFWTLTSGILIFWLIIGLWFKEWKYIHHAHNKLDFE